MTRRVFTTTGWNQRGDPIDLGVIDGVQTISYLTIDKAVAACVAGDVVEPCRPGMTGFSFYDADGLPLKTVTVPLGASWTIDKAITLQGGWCRLRLDGGAALGMSITPPENATFSLNDVYLTNFYLSGFYGGLRLITARGVYRFDRCAFLGLRSSTGYAIEIGSYVDCIFSDCAFYTPRYQSQPWSMSSQTIGKLRTHRCAGMIDNRRSSGTPVVTEVDCININGWTQEQLDATFVNPPDLSATWTADDWQNIDLRLLPTSPYATGATSVTSDQEVYDLAGNKRKVGGALGAYEVLDDTPTHYPCETTPGWRYTTTRDDDTAPTVLNHCVYKNANGSNVRQLEFPDAASVQRENSGAWTSVSRGSVIRTTLSAAARLFRATYDNPATEDSSFCYIQEYSPSESTAEGYSTATPCKMKWTDGRFFLNGNKAQITGASGAPDSSSVVYLGENTLFSDDARNVGKIIQEGFVHTDLGGAEGEIILGDRSTAKTCGKLTWRDQTTTSAAALARLEPRAPAELTFKDCNISDA